MPAGTSKHGEGVSSSGTCAVGTLTLTRGPHPLCLGEVDAAVVRSLAWLLHPWQPYLVTHSRPSISLTHVSLAVDI